MTQTLFDLPRGSSDSTYSFEDDLRGFIWGGRQTLVTDTIVADRVAPPIPTFVNEFWTSRQRAAHSLHEISYRACFKPQLPRFFIERLTRPGAIVYDPFMGRGTTVLEAGLLGRTAVGNDVNPLSRVLVEPRLRPPSLQAIRARLAEIDWTDPAGAASSRSAGDLARADLSAGALAQADDLLAFYHPDTLREIRALQRHLRARGAHLDPVDAWIRMVAVNRLTGHSPGFFSVYTLPPNQATSVMAQRKINKTRGQVPPRRDVAGLILRKSQSLLGSCGRHPMPAGAYHLFTAPAAATPDLPARSVDLVVTSPPFLDVVNYAADNWLRCWFCDIDPAQVKLTIVRKLEDWRREMTAVFHELTRVLRPGGHVAFEVGEVRGGTVKLEEHVIPCGVEAGLRPRLVLINTQQFTKTAACWGVDNNAKGTNTNRIVLFQRR
jgi:hypothetical protein